MDIEYTFIFCEKPKKVMEDTFTFTINWPVELQVGHVVELSGTLATRRFASESELDSKQR